MVRVISCNKCHATVPYRATRIAQPCGSDRPYSAAWIVPCRAARIVPLYHFLQHESCHSGNMDRALPYSMCRVIPCSKGDATAHHWMRHNQKHDPCNNMQQEPRNRTAFALQYYAVRAVTPCHTVQQELCHTVQLGLCHSAVWDCTIPCNTIPFPKYRS